MSDTKTEMADDRPMDAEALGQSAADRPFDGEWVKQRRLRNWAVLGLVTAICVMFYFITMIRIEQGAELRMQKAAEQAAVEEASAAILEAITPDVSAAGSTGGEAAE